MNYFATYVFTYTYRNGVISHIEIPITVVDGTVEDVRAAAWAEFYRQRGWALYDIVSVTIKVK